MMIMHLKNKFLKLMKYFLSNDNLNYVFHHDLNLVYTII